jgi:hypothetical protein
LNARKSIKQPSELDLSLAVAHGLRPDFFCRDRLGFAPDPWVNGSRVVTLPGDNPRTVRGYSAPALIVEAESAFVADETYDALIPMLAATPDGRIVLMSTPFVASGHFYSIWHNGSDEWEHYEHPTTECPRVDPAWLEARKREDPLRFNREYLCEFGNPEDSLFTVEMLDRMVVSDFEPLAL